MVCTVAVSVTVVPALTEVLEELRDVVVEDAVACVVLLPPEHPERVTTIISTNAPAQDVRSPSHWSFRLSIFFSAALDRSSPFPQ